MLCVADYIKFKVKFQKNRYLSMFEQCCGKYSMLIAYVQHIDCKPNIVHLGLAAILSVFWFRIFCLHAKLGISTLLFWQTICTEIKIQKWQLLFYIHEQKIDVHLYKASGRFSLTWISQISFWVLVTEALLNLNYKTIRETNCLGKHSLSDLLLLCLPKLNWSSTESGLGGIPQTISIVDVRMQ